MESFICERKRRRADLVADETPEELDTSCGRPFDEKDGTCRPFKRHHVPEEQISHGASSVRPVFIGPWLGRNCEIGPILERLKQSNTVTLIPRPTLMRSEPQQKKQCVPIKLKETYPPSKCFHLS